MRGRRGELLYLNYMLKNKLLIQAPYKKVLIYRITLIQIFIIKHSNVFDEAIWVVHIIKVQTLETKHRYKIDNIISNSRRANKRLQFYLSLILDADTHIHTNTHVRITVPNLFI